MPAFIDENQQFIDPETNAPIVNGQVFFGVQGDDPTVLANQITVFTDRGLTIPINQPIATNAAGRTEVKIWIPGRYSFAVKTSVVSGGTQKLIDEDAGSTEAVGTTVLTVISGANIITASADPVLTELINGEQFTLTAVAINTDKMTIDIDGTGAKPLKFNFNEEMAPGFIQANQTLNFTYNSTGAPSTDFFVWDNEGRGISILTNVAGDGNTITADGGPSVAGYVDQQLYQFKPDITNTGDVTLQVGSLSQIDCKDKGAQIRPAQFIANGIVIVSFNSIGPVFEVINTQDVGITIDTPQNTTSGTLVTFSGLPTIIKKVIIMFNGVSLTDGSDVIVRLNDQGSSTYISSSAKIADGINPEIISATTSFIINMSGAGEQFFGAMTLTLFDPSTNLWIATHTGRTSPSFVIAGGGSVILSAILSSIAIRSAGGPFDNGSVNLQFE